MSVLFSVCPDYTFTKLEMLWSVGSEFVVPTENGNKQCKVHLWFMDIYKLLYIFVVVVSVEVHLILMVFC